MLRFLHWCKILWTAPEWSMNHPCIAPAGATMMEDMEKTKKEDDLGEIMDHSSQ